jgi:hypothetical protein
MLAVPSSYKKTLAGLNPSIDRDYYRQRFSLRTNTDAALEFLMLRFGTNLSADAELIRMRQEQKKGA